VTVLVEECDFDHAAVFPSLDNRLFSTVGSPNRSLMVVVLGCRYCANTGDKRGGDYLI
jgi:hypothetical protein